MNAWRRVDARAEAPVAAVETLLRVRGLRIESRIDGSRRTIVDGVALDLHTGETIGIVGESGSGKSMTVRALLGLLPPGVHAAGSVCFDGEELLGLPESRLRRVRGAGISLVFQDPFTMLNPLQTAGRHIGETLLAVGAARSTLRAEILRRLHEVGIHDERVIDRYPFQLSGGMRQRVGIAAALARDCRVLAADEPATALDVTTQQEILTLLKRLQRERGMGFILVTHDLRVAFAVCDRIYVLYAGALLEVASPGDLQAEPLHPYTLGLMLSDPPLDRRLRSLATIEGAVPRPDDVAGCCTFAPRCAWTDAACRAGRPPLAAIAPARHSACVRIAEIATEMRSARAGAEQQAQIPDRATHAAPLVRVEKLRKQFGPVTALAGVTLDLAEREVTALVGESGSGKTTLGRCIAGFESADGGTIRIEGRDTTRLGALDTAARRWFRRTVQMVFQDPYSSLNPAWTIGATLREAIRVGAPDTRDLDARLGALLARVGLPAAYAARKPAALSGGERQRVAIARALAVRPKLLVCDEPVSAVDVSVQAQLLALFRSLQEADGMTLLFITHDLAVARQVADRIHVMYRGEIVESGPAAEVLDRPTHAYTKRLIASGSGAVA